MALADGKSCCALSFDYNQRHRQELQKAKELAGYYQVPHQIFKIDVPSFARSGLLSDIEIPQGRTLKEIREGGVPSTYVPGRNTLFLAYAMGQAEMLEAGEIHFGCNALDYTPYIDCRPAFITAFQAMMEVATWHPPKLVTPLIQWDKQAIIRKGVELKVPLEMTWSCYSPTADGKACSLCDACQLREDGFRQLNSP